MSALPDDAARYPGLAAGYESFYLRAVAPGGGLGVWLRYTVHRRSGADPAAALWATVFTPQGPTAAKASGAALGDGGGSWLAVGDARIGPGAATGEIVVAGGATIAWDLTFAGEPSHRMLPKPWMYRAPLPRTKPISLHPAARMSGTVTVDGRVLELDAWPGMVGHNWGTEHAERWIWLHGVAFDGAGRDTWLDCVVGRIRVAGRTLPWVLSGSICVDGERLPLGGPGRVRATRIDEAPDRLAFDLPGAGGLRVRGTIAAPRERFVGWVYADPDGSEHHTVNCSVADLELTVDRHGVPPLTLRAPGRGAYELGMRERDHGMAIQPYPDG